MTTLLCNANCRSSINGVCILDVAKIELDKTSRLANLFNCFLFDLKPPNQCNTCGNIIQEWEEGHHSRTYTCEICGRETLVTEDEFGRVE